MNARLCVRTAPGRIDGLMKFLNSAHMLISIFVGLLFVWMNREEIMPPLESFFPLGRVGLHAVMLSAIAGIGFYLLTRIGRWLRNEMSRLYRMTKKSQFMALRDQIDDVLWLPWPMQEGVLYTSDTKETRLLDPPSRRKVMMLEAELRRLGIPVPQIDYTRNYHDYFQEVFSYVVQGDRRGCITMSRTYREPKTPKEEAFDKMRQGGPETMSDVSPHLQARRNKGSFVG